MKCYYEVLNVPQTANESEIKSSYRKLALKWHPDKNLESPDLAKDQFQIVQQAYDVLSDKQERAWYDNHREQILRGSSSDFEDKSLDVFQYFTTSCFKGFEDDDGGFYSVYRNVFEKIAKEDIEFMEDKEEFCEIPNFGNSKTDFQKVSEFYAYWTSYSTKKSFVWLDPHDITNIRDRRYIKLVEKENKKIRQKARKERNEEVRNLVAFVRKRDKRVQAQKKIQEQKILEDKKKRETLSKQKKLERQEELDKARVSCQAEWTKFDNVQSELEQIERELAEEFGDVHISEDENEIDSLYCIACSKLFKTPKAFENHESSKKHKENMEFLKGTLLEDDILDSESLSENDHLDTNDEIIDTNDEVNNTESVHSDEDLLEDINKNKKKKKKSNVIVIEEDESCSNIPLNINSEDFNFDDTTKKQKKKNKKDTKSRACKNKQVDGANETEYTAQQNGNFNPSVMKQNNKKDVNLNALKNKKANKVNGLSEPVTSHICVTCRESFSSKNKLFGHLKNSGHGVYIPPNLKTK